MRIECCGCKTTLLKVSLSMGPSAGRGAGDHSRSSRCIESRGHTGTIGRDSSPLDRATSHAGRRLPRSSCGSPSAVAVGPPCTIDGCHEHFHVIQHPIRYPEGGEALRCYPAGPHVGTARLTPDRPWRGSGEMGVPPSSSTVWSLSSCSRNCFLAASRCLGDICPLIAPR
jgi:hypothetical protein